MAITNAQQYQQLVNKPANGKRPGYRGPGEYQGGRGYGGSKSSGGKKGGGGGYTGGGGGGKDASTKSFDKSLNPDRPGGPIGRDDSGATPPQEFIGGKSYDVTPDTVEQRNFARSIAADAARREKRKRALRERTMLEKLGMLGYTDRTLDDNLVDIGAIDEQFGTIGGVPIGFVGPAIGAFTVDPATNYFDEDSIREIASTKTTTGGSLSAKDADTLGDIREDITMRDRILDPNDKVTQSEFNEYMNRNKVELPDDGGGSELLDPCKGPNPPAYCFINQPKDEAPTTTQSPFAFRFLADGGRAQAMDGGIMDADIVGGMMDGNMDEMGRQMYGLGKLVKKATRGIKKLVKSPIGKAALLYAGGSFLSGKGLFGGLKGAGFLKSEGLKNFFLKDATKKFALDNLSQKGLMTGIAGLSALPFLFQGDEEEEFDPYRGPDIDIAAIRGDPYGAMGGAYRLAADGGLMRQNYDEAGAVMSKEEMKKLSKSPLYKGFKLMYGVDPQQARDNDSYKDKFSQFEQLYKKGYQEGGDVEPVAKKTMPLIDMDGKEKDYRETGGFVDMGRMERADDVPARLSKNEFVFTADAVRNAGEGDIDKGAEVMYNMMKNLEAGGEVSEESQGLEGARKMFQTSQRLGEVI